MVAAALTTATQLVTALPDGVIDATSYVLPVRVREHARRTSLSLAADPRRRRSASAETALALQVAHRVGGDFPDGQLWTQLSDSAGRPREAREALAELLRALGESDSRIPASARERAALYRSRLACRRMLIVADGASSARQVRPLLPGSGGSAVLVTSQSAMAFPPGSRLVPVSPFSASEALALLTRVIGRSRVAAEPQAAAELAAAFGGLPLAVRIIAMQLAARRTSRLATCAARLGEPGTGIRRLAFGELSVSASLALIGDKSAEAIAALTDRSLLITGGTDQTGGTRYTIHDLVRDFAVAQLDRSA